MNGSEFLLKLINKQNLDREEAIELAEILLSEKTPAALSASLLTGLKIKGETEEEILGFIDVLRGGMKRINYEATLIDTCGTGGDGQNTFNISTAVSLVCAGAGIKVAKHGNRSASGKSGSADVFEALGVDINLTANSVKNCLDNSNIAFLFAPSFHPLMKTIGPIRRELKIPTIFNLIGPLLNPLGVKRQIIGVANKENAYKLSRVCGQLYYEHALIINSEDGMDEISIYDETGIYEIKNGKISKFLLNPGDFGLSGKNRAEIKITNVTESRVKLLEVLNGTKGDPRKITVLNAGAALYISGKYKSIGEGIRAAESAIDSGRALTTLNNFINLSRKKYE